VCVSKYSAAMQKKAPKLLVYKRKYCAAEKKEIKIPNRFVLLLLWGEEGRFLDVRAWTRAKRTKLEALVGTKIATRPPNKVFTTSHLYTCLFSSLWGSVSAWSIVGFDL